MGFVCYRHGTGKDLEKCIIMNNTGEKKTNKLGFLVLCYSFSCSNAAAQYLCRGRKNDLWHQP